MLQLVQELSHYNHWANGKMRDWLRQIDDVQWTQPFGGSFFSIRETVLHIAGAEKIWLERLVGDPQPFLTLTFEGDKTALLDTWAQQTQNLLDYAGRASEATLQETFAFKTLNGVASEMERYKALVHVLNHSTYHRGQVVNYLRQAGFADVSSTDLMQFYRL